MGKPTVEMADKSFSSMNVIAPFFYYILFFVPYSAGMSATTKTRSRSGDNRTLYP